MNTKVNKLFIFTCMLILFTPLVLLTFQIKIEDQYSTQKINHNFERNFPLKVDLFRVYSYLKKTVFKMNPIPNKAITTNSGWLFCGDTFGDALSESFGLIQLKANEIEKINYHLRFKKDLCKKHQASFFLAVAPNKETVYSHLIPIKKSHKPTKWNQLETICKQINLPFINLGANFPSNPSYPLYFKTDTHWNENGSYFGYVSIIEALNQYNPSWNLKPIERNKFYIHQTDKFVGDIKQMLIEQKTEPFTELDLIIKPNDSAKKTISKLKIPKEYTFNPLMYESRYIKSSQPLKIIMFGDSFSPFLTKFLKEHFREIVVIWGYKFDEKIIIDEKPDIVILEIVERNIDLLIEDI